MEMVPTDIQKFPWKGKQRDQVASGDGSEVKRLVFFCFLLLCLGTKLEHIGVLMC